MPVVVAALAVSGCSDDDEAGEVSTTSTLPAALAEVLAADQVPIPPDAVVVGAALDLSGPRSGPDTAVGVVVDVEVERLDRAGGLGGRPVVLRIADTGGTVQGASDAASSLVDDGAAVVITGCVSDPALAAATMAQSRNALALVPCAPDPDLGLGVGPLVFSLALTNPLQGQVLAEQAVAQGAGTAIALSEVADPDSGEQCDRFVERFTELGGRVVARVEVAEDTLPADEVGDALNRFDQPGVFVSCLGQPTVGTALPDLREAGHTAPILASAGGDVVPLVAELPGEVIALGPVIGSLAPEHQALVDSGFLRSHADLAGIASVQAFAAAVAGAGGALDGPALAVALENAGALDLVVGVVTFSPGDHSPADRPVVLRGHTADGASFQLERRAGQ